MGRNPSFHLSHLEISYVHSPTSDLVHQQPTELAGRGDVPISLGLQARPDHAALVHFYNGD